MKKVERDCPAKINLLLKILGKRADGFHELVTVMQAIDLCDHIEVWKKSGSVELETDSAQLPTDQRNLMVQATLAFLEKIGTQEGVGLKLQKRIPTAAGLGGGSSDAANTLVALNQLFDNPLEYKELHEICSQLGSDIPFFLKGGTALCEGRGEKVEHFASSADFGLVLINPGLPLSTKEVYQSLDPSTTTLLTDPQELSRMIIKSLETHDLGLLNQALVNDLEGAAIKKLPVLTTVMDLLKKSGFEKPLVSGSGPTLFALTQNLPILDDKIEEMRSSLPENYSFFSCCFKGGEVF